uniref:Cytochrome P450 n=1 Tax=Acrobeloides nanus TaxID=290746 RepID=A0A914EBD2_9BILA
MQGPSTRLHEYGDKIYGPGALPIIGNAHKFPASSDGFLQYVAKNAQEAVTCGESVMRLWIGETLYVFPLNGEAAKTILESNTELTKSSDYDFFLPWLGTGLLISTDEKWRIRRKLLTPSFHFNMLDGFFEVFNREDRIFVENLDKYADGVQTVDLYPLIKHMALDIICGTAMGIELNAQGDPNQPYVRAVETFNKLAFEHNLYPWNWIGPIWYATGKATETKETLDVLLGFTQKVIKERAEIFDELKASGQKIEKKRTAFLDMLLNMKDVNQLSQEDIREEVDTFMFEGHDTTSSGIGWICWCLATHPEIQEKCYQEIFQYFGDSDRDVTLDDLKELKYLERCIKETMRVFPPVPVVLRKLKDDLEMGGKTVPRGSTITIFPYILHHNKEVFPNHDVFDPDNFLPENIAKRHNYSYIPFSAGPRNCIGQKFAFYEEKMTMIWVLRKYKLLCDYKLHDNTPCSEAILRPKMGIPLKLERRD